MSRPRAAAPVDDDAAPLHPHVQRLIDTAPRLEGQRRLDLTALLLQARATPVPTADTAA